jgi:hypothetical protein
MLPWRVVSPLVTRGTRLVLHCRVEISLLPLLYMWLVIEGDGHMGRQSNCSRTDVMKH